MSVYMSTCVCIYVDKCYEFGDRLRIIAARALSVGVDRMQRAVDQRERLRVFGQHRCERTGYKCFQIRMQWLESLGLGVRRSARRVNSSRKAVAPKKTPFAIAHMSVSGLFVVPTTVALKTFCMKSSNAKSTATMS